MTTLCTIGIILALIHSVCSVHQETTQTSNSACYGTSGPITMTLNCTNGNVIAIEQIWVGAKQISTSCPTIFLTTSTDESCCSPSAIPADDCLFAFDHSNYDNYHTACNGRRECTVQVQNVLTVLGSCNQTIYPVTTTFAYIDYVCIDAASLTTMCSTTSANVTSSTYIASADFPSGMTTSTSPCTCSVQTDDPSATLQMVTIQRQLTGNAIGSCNQSLSLLDSGQNSLVEWSCSDNTYVEETFDVGSDYVTLNLKNDRTVADGTFWIEIRASSSTANLMMNCSTQLLTTSSTSTSTTSTPTDTTTTSSTSTSTTSTPTDTTTTSSTSTSTTFTQTDSTTAITSTQALTTTTSGFNTATCMQTSSTTDDSSYDAYLIVVICLSILLFCSFVGNAVLIYKHFGKTRGKQSVEITQVQPINQPMNRRYPGPTTRHK